MTKLSTLERRDLFFSRRMVISRTPYYNFITNEGVGVERADLPKQLLEIIKLCTKDSNGVLECAVFCNREFRVESSLSYGVVLNFYTGCIRVYRVNFETQRKGYMTSLYKILKSIQKEYDLGKIIIDCVISDEMLSWCNKNGFVGSGSMLDYRES